MILSFLNSCFDINERTYWNDEKYEITDNPGIASCKTLYLKLDNGDGIGRVDFISRIGSNNTYIIAESIKNGMKEYWILNKGKDSENYNASEYIEGPFDISTFDIRREELEILQLDFETNLE